MITVKIKKYSKVRKAIDEGQISHIFYFSNFSRNYSEVMNWKSEVRTKNDVSPF